MYTVTSLAVLGIPAKAGTPLQTVLPSPAHLTWCGTLLACPDRGRGPQPRPGLGQARGALPGEVAGSSLRLPVLRTLLVPPVLRTLSTFGTPYLSSTFGTTYLE